MIKLNNLKISKIILVIAVLGLIVLPLAGCGGGGSTNSGSNSNNSGSDSSKSGGSSDNSSTGASSGSAEPFKIGLIVPKSSVFATLGENLVNGMKMYFDEIGWKAGGREIKLLEEDEENDPQAA